MRTQKFMHIEIVLVHCFLTRHNHDYCTETRPAIFGANQHYATNSVNTAYLELNRKHSFNCYLLKASASNHNRF